MNCGPAGRIPVALTKDHVMAAYSGPSATNQAFPREFHNKENFQVSEECRNQTMLLLPIYSDGHMYDEYHGEDPGVARVVYGGTTKPVCLFLFKSGNGFQKCTPTF